MDLISEIPGSIIETILTKLPIRDAVKTSILSPKWRYKWASLTHLVFDYQSLSTHDNQEKIIDFITCCLFLHDGPIHKFSLFVFNLKISQNIDRWLLFISRKGIKELTISANQFHCFRVPYSVFSCLGLTNLVLSRCELNLHPDFKGFPCLKCLDLHEVSITPEDIEFLISRCPLLESLTLSFFNCLKLTVQAPNLKHLVLEGEFTDLCLGSMPLLIDIFFDLFITNDIIGYLSDRSSCTFEKLLGGAPKLEKLTGRFTEYMCIGNEQRRNPITFHHLKCVEFYDVCFGSMDEVVAMLQILVNSPILEALQTSDSHHGDGWSTEDPSLDVWGKNCTFRRLKTVKMTEFDGSHNQMMFLEFLLKHSPSLEVMSIVPCIILEQKERLDMSLHLASFSTVCLPRIL